MIEVVVEYATQVTDKVIAHNFNVEARVAA